MSGAITATTIAAIAAAGVGAVGTGVGIYQGIKSSDAQKAALQKQNTAQQQATSQALSTERQSAIAQNAANTKTPDIAGILQRAATVPGASSTMLTGAGGAKTGSLGGTSLLGA